MVYYSNLSANGTRGLSRALVNLKDSLPAGWNGVMAADSDSVRYLLVANFNATKPATIHLPLTTLGYPVLRETATDGQVTLVAEQNNSVAEEVRFFVDDPSAVTCQSADNPNVAYVKSADGRSMTVRVTAVTAEGIVTKTVVTRATVRLTIQGGEPSRKRRRFRSLRPTRSRRATPTSRQTTSATRASRTTLPTAR